MCPEPEGIISTKNDNPPPAEESDAGGKRKKREKGVVMKSKAVAVLALVAGLTLSVGWARPAAPESNDLLRFLPDGNTVFVLDVKKIISSSLWATISSHDPAKGALEHMQSEMSEIGVKLTDISTVAVVFQDGGGKDAVVAANGAFNQNDLLARLRGDQKVKLTSEKYKNFDIYTVKGIAAESKKSGPENFDASFVFYEDGIVVAGPPASVRASVDVKTGQRPSVAQNEKLGAALAQNPTAAARFAIMLTSGMMGSIKTSELPLPDFSTISMAFGAIDVTSGVDLNVTLRSDTAEHAKSIADSLNGLLGMARGFLGAGVGDQKGKAIAETLKSVTITGVDVDVKITGNLSAEVLAEVLRAGHS